MQKKWIIILGAALGTMFLLVTASFVLGVVGVSQSDASETQQDTITVYGQGKVSVSPDIAYVTLGYENSASSPQAAQHDNTAMMAQVTAALREAGVAQGDIRSAQFNVYQEYYYGDSPDAQSYRVSSTVNITVRQVDRADDIITAACSAGANTSYGITYDLIDRQAAYTKALGLARMRADEKAAKLAKELGRSLAGITEISEYGSTQCDTEYSDYGSAGGLTDYATESAVGGGLEISAVVYVTYRLE